MFKVILREMSFGNGKLIFFFIHLLKFCILVVGISERVQLSNGFEFRNGYSRRSVYHVLVPDRSIGNGHFKIKKNQISYIKEYFLSATRSKAIQTFL